jgi:hypothetical protein
MSDAEIMLQTMICFATVSAENANVEGMKAENCTRESRGHAMAYDDSAFFEVQSRIEAALTNLRTATGRLS